MKDQTPAFISGRFLYQGFKLPGSLVARLLSDVDLPAGFDNINTLTERNPSLSEYVDGLSRGGSLIDRVSPVPSIRVQRNPGRLLRG
jgi:hypothetical protein